MFGDYSEDQSPETLETTARKDNCEVIFAASDILQLDLDDTSLDRFRELYKAAKDVGLLKGWIEAVWRSKSGEGWHVVIALARAQPVEERVMLQALLGSDPMREILNLGKHPDTICLFRPKVAL